MEGGRIEVTSGENSMKKKGIGFLGYREEGLGFCLSGFTAKSKRERERERERVRIRALVF